MLEILDETVAAELQVRHKLESVQEKYEKLDQESKQCVSKHVETSIGMQRQVESLSATIEAKAHVEKDFEEVVQDE